MKNILKVLVLLALSDKHLQVQSLSFKQRNRPMLPAMMTREQALAHH